MPTTIHLVRHGQTVWHEGNKYAGATDVALTQLGHDQASAFAHNTQQLQVSAIYSSDLQRAHDTATPTASELGLPVVIDERLREVNYGAGEGLTSAQHQGTFPEAAAAFAAHPADAPYPEGESGRAAHDRAHAALAEIATAHPDAAVLVFTHATIIRLLTAGYLGLDLNEYRRSFPLLDNCTITTFALEGASARGRLVRFNAPLVAATN